jgi:chromosome segregation ATPase
MSASQSARSGLTAVPENDLSADATLLAKLQQTVTLANENCDRATALVRTLSAELRDAQQRIRDLEGRLKTEATLVQLQAEFDAEAENHLTRLLAELAQARQRAAEAGGRVAQIEKDADERVARAEAEADERIARAGVESEGVFARLKREVAEAQQRAERAEAEAERIRREADEHVRRVEWDAEKSLEQLRAGARDEVSRLQFDLAEAEDRAKRAEQWVARIRQEVEGALMRSPAAGRRNQYP